MVCNGLRAANAGRGPEAWRTRETAEQKRDILERHKQLALAIANHDAAEAESRMAAHFDEAIGALLR
jgi:DNA-binding FadR family transcriptional regulator